MLVHRKKRPRVTVQMPLAALIDIVFLLLIYFLLTTNFISDEGIDIRLPVAKVAEPRPLQEITVVIDAQGQVYLKGNKMTPDELLKTLRALIPASEDRLVVVKADRGVLLDKAVTVMDLARAAGAARLCLATENEFQGEGG